MENQYSAENIQVLSFNEGIRKRPGMYVGSMDNNGFTNTLKNLLQDIYELGGANIITIELVNTHSINVKFESICKEIPTKWFYYESLDSSKFAEKRSFFVALQSLKSLSTDFTVYSKDFEQIYKDGNLIKDTKEAKNISSSELEIKFTLDKQFWGNDFEFNVNYVHQQIQEFAFLNKGIKFKLNYLVDNEQNKSIFYFKNGLKDKIDIEILKGRGTYLEMNIEMKAEYFELETVFAFLKYDVDESILKSYVNKEYTHQNGTHVTAVLKGIYNGLIKYIQKHDLDKDVKISKQKIIKNILILLT